MREKAVTYFTILPRYSTHGTEKKHHKLCHENDTESGYEPTSFRVEQEALYGIPHGFLLSASSDALV
jgi:hypothetical protein